MKRILFATLGFALLLSACGSADKSNNPQATEASGDKPNDPQVALETSEGKEFKVVLESNPSTGYHWEIVGELDAKVVEFVSKDFKNSSSSPMPGSGGRDTFTFKAVGAGQTTITLGYYPPSNDPVEPEKTETFTVTVK